MASCYSSFLRDGESGSFIAVLASDDPVVATKDDTEVEARFDLGVGGLAEGLAGVLAGGLARGSPRPSPCTAVMAEKIPRTGTAGFP